MFSDMMFVLVVANTGLVIPVEGVVSLVVHHERVVHEVEAVRPRLEGVRHHLLGQPLVYARELIDVLTGVHAVRNAEPKVEIKCFQVLLTEKVSFNHSKILQRFVANFQLDRSAHISEF